MYAFSIHYLSCLVRVFVWPVVSVVVRAGYTRSGQMDLKFESAVQSTLVRCERRLAYSALPLTDNLFDLIQQHDQLQDVTTHASSVELHDQSVGFVGPINSQPSSGQDIALTQPVTNFANDVSAFATAAHMLTGLETARQSYGLTGRGQTVAVIDSGIAYDHVALGGGFGANFRVVGGYDFAEQDSNPYDDAPAGYHGTAVAGVIGGSGSVYPGVAPGVDLVALRVFDDLGRGTIQSVESALRWVHDNRNNFANPITVVNLSLGVDFNGTTAMVGAILEDELQLLRNDGITVVASAGNSFAKYQTPGLAYPASSPLVLPVSSVDSNGLLSDFSQRTNQSIAAPGRQITSTVPDHLLGADGRVDDYSTVSGTSFSSPYVAGSLALLREAYSLIGVNSVSVDALRNTLFGTADSIFDSITNASYSRLNLFRALDSILPDDNVGDSPSTALSIDHGGRSTGTVTGFLNQINDQDLYRWTAQQSGTLSLSFSSDNLVGSQWQSWASGQQVFSAAANSLSIAVQAGQTYAFGVHDSDQIGGFKIDWGFAASATGSSGTNNGNITAPTTAPVDLGFNPTGTTNLSGTSYHSVHAINEGTLTLQIDNVASSQSSLRVFDSSGRLVANDVTVQNGQLRVDLDVSPGQVYSFQSLLGAGNTAQLRYANLVDVDGTNLRVFGTNSGDDVSVSLSNGVAVTVGGIDYAWQNNAIRSVSIDQGGGADTLRIIGSRNMETVQMYSDRGSIASTDVQVQWLGTERVEFRGGGGADRVYAYDTNGNDELVIRPNQFQLNGAGYQFVVEQAERLYIDASRGGNDRATIFDSSGDDRLSVRPQFSSITGPGYFNFITGFERIYAYATAGGNDSATLYDSTGKDTFTANADVATIVGPNYNAFTRYFKNVESIASAGGDDTAFVYTPNNAQNFSGTDFVSYRQNEWTRSARGFETVNSIALIGSSAVQAATVIDAAAIAPVSLEAVPAVTIQSAEPSSTVNGNEHSAIAHDQLSAMEATEMVGSIAWLEIDAEQSQVLSKIDPLTLALLDPEREQLSLDMFFESVGGLA